MSSEDKQQKEFKKILNALLAQPHNKFCADCGASRPTWASSKIGVFICMKCAGIHRSLGTHISFVRSVDLDKWKLSELEVVQEVGNLKAAQIYEATLPPNYPRPSSLDSAALEKFIRAKYQYQKFYSATPNVNIRRASTERRPVLTDLYDPTKEGRVSPRKVIRKPPPHTQQSPTAYVRAPEHLSSPTQPPPQQQQVQQPSTATLNLFGPTPTQPQTQSNIFGSLEMSNSQPKPQPNNDFFSSIESNDQKACSTATKNEILGLFDQPTTFGQPPYGQTTQQQNLNGLFGNMSIGGPQLYTQQQQYQPQLQPQLQPQIQQQQLLQQQLLQQQLYQQQLLQQQLYQQQLQQQQQVQQNDFALLSKIQAKGGAQPQTASLF